MFLFGVREKGVGGLDLPFFISEMARSRVRSIKIRPAKKDMNPTEG
jgi:hypothetical protein